MSADGVFTLSVSFGRAEASKGEAGGMESYSGFPIAVRRGQVSEWLFLEEEAALLDAGRGIWMGDPFNERLFSR